ncbi:MAG: hypothetical protein WAV56_04425 [Microgenomates group bacterium]
MKRKIRNISPLYLSLLHLLPSLLLLVLIVIGFVSLSYSDKHQTVLGAQTALPQVKTETVEERLDELTEVEKTTKSEAVEKAKVDLFR